MVCLTDCVCVRVVYLLCFASVRFQNNKKKGKTADSEFCFCFLLFVLFQFLLFICKKTFKCLTRTKKLSQTWAAWNNHGKRSITLGTLKSSRCSTQFNVQQFCSDLLLFFHFNFLFCLFPTSGGKVHSPESTVHFFASSFFFFSFAPNVCFCCCLLIFLNFFKLLCILPSQPLPLPPPEPQSLQLGNRISQKKLVNHCCDCCFGLLIALFFSAT